MFVAWKTAGGGGFKEVRVADDTTIKPTPFDQWEEEALELERKYKHMTPTQVAQSMLDEEDENVGRGLAGTLNSLEVDESMKNDQEEIDAMVKFIRQQPKAIREPFWDDEEPDPDLITMDDSDEFEENDMTDIAHAKLEEHREQREYARVAIWEMPLLSSESSLVSFVEKTRAMAREDGVTNSGLSQSSQRDSSPQRLNSPCDFGTRRIWASSTRRRKRWSWSSARVTWASRISRR